MGAVKLINGVAVPLTDADIEQREVDRLAATRRTRALPPVSKAALYDSLTDEEMETLDAFLRKAPARQRRMWDEAEGGRVPAEVARALVTRLFSAERVAALLP